MTSIIGDPRTSFGIPEETWFHELAASSDWRELGVMERADADLEETRRVFMAIWALSREADIMSFPRTFPIEPGSPEALGALEALRSIGALEVVAAVQSAPVIPIGPELPPNATLDERLTYYRQMDQHRRAGRERLDLAYKVAKDVREHLIRYLDERKVFPLDDSRERLARMYGVNIGGQLDVFGPRGLTGTRPPPPK